MTSRQPADADGIIGRTTAVVVHGDFLKSTQDLVP